MRTDAPPSPREAIGLIAGAGSLPLALAHAVKSRGHPLVCLALEGADPSLARLADYTYPVQFGQMEAVITALKRHGVVRMLVAGGVSRTDLLDRGDAMFQHSMGDATSDRRDQKVFSQVLPRIRELGFEIMSLLEFLPDLVVPAGVLTTRAPTDQEWNDIRLGMSVAQTMAGFDVGQTVVLKRGVMLAVEAAEGTDAAIRRGGSMARGSVVVKAARPNQDPRFDLPTIGMQTVALLEEIGATALAVEAGKTLLLNRPDALATANRAGITVVGVELQAQDVKGSRSSS